MPPKPKFTKEEIVQTALEIVSQKGVRALTANELGAALGTSARPIFTVFDSMKEGRTRCAKPPCSVLRALQSGKCPICRFSSR